MNWKKETTAVLIEREETGINKKRMNKVQKNHIKAQTEQDK